MRIAITRRDTSLSHPDGINIAMFSLACGLQRLGHEVIYIGAAIDNPAGIDRDFHVSKFPTLRCLAEGPLSRERCVRLWARSGRRLVRDLEPDFVLNNGVLPRRLGPKEAEVVHDWESVGRGGQHVRALAKRVSFRRADFVFATCPELVEIASEVGRTIRLLPNSIDLEGRPLNQTNGRVPTFVHVGTAPYKDPLTSIRAFAATAQAEPSARLIMVGAENEIVNECVGGLPAPIRSRVEVAGFVSAERMLQIHAEALAVIVPSRYDRPVASPTVLEAFSVGTPVLASSISKDILVDGVNGFSLDSGRRLQDLTEVMGRLLSQRADWTQLSQNARRTAERFECTSIARALIQQLASGSPLAA